MHWQVSKNDFWFCMMKFLSSEVFPTATPKRGEADEGSVDLGSETQDRADYSVDGDSAESEKNDDADEPSNFFEFLHSNLAPSRRLKSAFFDTDTLVLNLKHDFSNGLVTET
jgi:hypothetical protein